MNSIQSSSKILVIGSVLLDHYQATNKKHLGGACFNFAYHVHQLIGDLDFLSRVGVDEAGNFILRELTKRHFPTTFIQIDHAKPTKTVTVLKNSANEPHYIIASDVATEYLVPPTISHHQLANYQLVYFGTTIQSGAKSRTTLRQILEQTNQIKLCDINLRPGKSTPETIDYALNQCSVLKLNHEELNILKNMYHITGHDRDAMLALAKRFNISSICLTKAENGSLLYHHHDFTLKSIKPGVLIDPVGAGDAFTSILAIGLLHQWPAKKILSIASDFASAVCQIQGAVPDRLDFYNQWRDQVLR